MARINIAMSVAPTSAPVPFFSEGNVVFNGRKEGYVQDQLSQIINVYEDAIKLNRRVL